MSYIIISEPGTKYGPCIEPCKHRDCAESRATAAAICPLCEEPLGYGNPITKDRNGREAHLVCLEIAIEKHQQEDC